MPTACRAPAGALADPERDLHGPRPASLGVAILITGVLLAWRAIAAAPPAGRGPTAGGRPRRPGGLDRARDDTAEARLGPPFRLATTAGPARRYASSSPGRAESRGTPDSGRQRDALARRRGDVLRTVGQLAFAAATWSRSWWWSPTRSRSTGPSVTSSWPITFRRRRISRLGRGRPARRPAADREGIRAPRSAGTLRAGAHAARSRTAWRPVRLRAGTAEGRPVRYPGTERRPGAGDGPAGRLDRRDRGRERRRKTTLGEAAVPLLRARRRALLVDGQDLAGCRLPSGEPGSSPAPGLRGAPSSSPTGRGVGDLPRIDDEPADDRGPACARGRPGRAATGPVAGRPGGLNGRGDVGCPYSPPVSQTTSTERLHALPAGRRWALSADDPAPVKTRWVGEDSTALADMED